MICTRASFPSDVAHVRLHAGVSDCARMLDLTLMHGILVGEWLGALCAQAQRSPHCCLSAAQALRQPTLVRRSPQLPRTLLSRHLKLTLQAALILLLS